MKILYYNCPAGICGDMNLGAMVDLGVDPQQLIAELKKLNLDGWEVSFSADQRKGISGTRCDVTYDGQEDHEHDHHHDHDFTTWTYRSDEPMSWKKLAPTLEQLPISVFRVKGLLNLAERPGDRILLHVVGRRIYVRTVEPWGDRTPKTELVMISFGTPIDPTAMDSMLSRCRSASP